MIGTAGVLLAYAVIISVVFLVLFGAPWRYRDLVYAWFAFVFALVELGLLGLLLASLWWPVPIWVGLLVLVAHDGVLTWRVGLFLAEKYRNRRPDETTESSVDDGREPSNDEH